MCANEPMECLSQHINPTNFIWEKEDNSQLLIHR